MENITVAQVVNESASVDIHSDIEDVKIHTNVRVEDTEPHDNLFNLDYTVVTDTVSVDHTGDVQHIA